MGRLKHGPVSPAMGFGIVVYDPSDHFDLWT